MLTKSSKYLWQYYFEKKVMPGQETSWNSYITEQIDCKERLFRLQSGLEMKNYFEMPDSFMQGMR